MYYGVEDFIMTKTAALSDRQTKKYLRQIGAIEEAKAKQLAKYDKNPRLYQLVDQVIWPHAYNQRIAPGLPYITNSAYRQEMRDRDIAYINDVYRSELAHQFDRAKSSREFLLNQK